VADTQLEVATRDTVRDDHEGHTQLEVTTRDTVSDDHEGHTQLEVTTRDTVRDDHEGHIQLEVTVRDGDTLVTKLRHVGGLCAEQRSNVTCMHREFLYQRRCLERTDDDNKFFVEHNDGMCVTPTRVSIDYKSTNQAWLWPPYGRGISNVAIRLSVCLSVYIV